MYRYYWQLVEGEYTAANETNFEREDKMKSKILTAVWFYFKFFVLPMGIYLGIYGAGLPFDHVLGTLVAPIMNVFDEPPAIVFYIVAAISYPSAIIGYLLPDAFSYNKYWMTFFLYEETILLPIYTVALATTSPKIPQFIKKRFVEAHA